MTQVTSKHNHINVANGVNFLDSVFFLPCFFYHSAYTKFMLLERYSVEEYNDHHRLPASLYDWLDKNNNSDDIFTNERLYRMKIVDSPECSPCNKTSAEVLLHVDNCFCLARQIEHAFFLMSENTYFVATG